MDYILPKSETDKLHRDLTKWVKETLMGEDVGNSVYLYNILLNLKRLMEDKKR